MSIAAETTQQALIARPAGRVDYEASADFQRGLEALVAQAKASGLGLVVNCAAISFLSSAGLRAFLVAARAAKSAGLAFCVCCLTPAVKEVFDLSGFSVVIRVADTEAGAVSAA
jgi:anti-sigma B factor antagonist